jgi:hypothetical protein
MSTNVLFIGWDRAVPGREVASAEHFAEALQFLGGLQQAGKLDSFEPVLLETHGGDLNGFVLVRGDAAQLNALAENEEWQKHLVVAGFNMEGFGAVRGVTGEGVAAWMARWNEIISA